MATANLGITLPTVGGSTDTWGTTLNTGITAIDALFSVSGTDVTMSDIKFNSMSVQETGAGTDTVKIQAPSAVSTSYTLTMPAAVGTTNQVLSAADGSGTLAWTTPETGDITSVVAGAGMTGGGTSGAVTLNVIGTADKITVSADAVTIASTYVGQSSITTLGTIATGVWNGSVIQATYGGSGLVGAADGTIAIADGSGAPTTLDVGSSTAITILGTVATGVWNGTAIANANLANSTVAYGGVTLALGASDATPAFNLSDATAYTGDSALVTTGTITSGTWQGTTVAVNQGGTGLASYTAGDVIYASGSTTLAKLAKGSDTEVLTLASGVPTWAAPTTGDLTAIVAGAGLTGTSLSGPIPTLNVIGTSGTITVSADAVTIASDYVGQSTITTLGTIGTGVWNGTAITGAYIDPTSSPLASTKIWIGSGSNVAAEFALSGNATMTAGGVVTVSTAAACTGNAATATALQTARTIGGTSFDGTANIAVALSATATALATARAINGVNFDGTAAITVTAAAGTLTGGTLNSGVTASSLTSLGTIGSLVATSADINGGTLDGATVGASSPSTGAFTTLAASSTLAVTGNIGQGGVPWTGAAIRGIGTTSGASGQYGFLWDGTFDSSATANGTGVGVTVKTAASLTMTNGYGVRIQVPGLGSGSAITNLYGLKIENQAVGGTTNYAIYTGTGAVSFGDTLAVTGTSTLTGNVGIGQAAGTPALTVLEATGSEKVALFDNNHASTPYGIKVDYSGATPNNAAYPFLECEDATAVRLDIWSNGNVYNFNGTYGQLSDERLKTDIAPARSQWDDIKWLGANAISYRFLVDGDDAQTMLGWGAQSVEAAGMGGLVELAGEDETYTLKTSIIHTKAVIALGEALVRIEALEAQLANGG